LRGHILINGDSFIFINEIYALFFFSILSSLYGLGISIGVVVRFRLRDLGLPCFLILNFNHYFQLVYFLSYDGVGGSFRVLIGLEVKEFRLTLFLNF
jgi:hypothetical protein